MTEIKLTEYGRATANIDPFAVIKKEDKKICCAVKVSDWRQGEDCERYAKIEIAGKTYCKSHGLMHLYAMLFVNKTHKIVKSGD